MSLREEENSDKLRCPLRNKRYKEQRKKLTKKSIEWSIGKSAACPRHQNKIDSNNRYEKKW